MEENPENIASNDADDSLSFVESELEALQSIYINEIQVKQDDDQKCTCVSIDLHPATADKPEEQYVKMTLKFTLSKEYPHSIPEISIRNPRGLSDEKINSTYQDLISIAEKKIGNSMLFEIIEAAKEHLTAGNRPCGECAICLYGFSESDVFIKTDCYHYFHSHCLARYAKNATASDKKEADSSSDDATNNELLCPMCRVPIQFSGGEESYPPPSTGDDECMISEQIQEIQKKMADLFQKQLEKGGIIDVEAEKNKFLLEISNVPTLSNAVEKSDAVTEENDSSVNDENTSNTPQLPLSDTAQNTKEAKSAAIKSDDKSKNKRFNKRGSHNSHSSYPRNNRKQKTHYDSFDDDFDDEDSFRSSGKDQNQVDVETGLPQNKDTANADPHSKFSPIGKEGHRRGGPYKPRRGNHNNGFNRGNYSRYPRKTATGYNSNQRQHFDQANQDTRRFSSGKDVSPQSDSSKNAPDSPLDETTDSQGIENAPDSFRRHSDFDRRGKSRGRFPRNNQRGRGGNYQGNAPRRDNYGRNRHGDGYQNRREQDSFNSRYPNDGERNSQADTEVSTFCEEDAQCHRDTDANGRNYRNNPLRQSRGNSHRDSGSSHVHEASSKQGDDSHEAESPGNDPVNHKNQSPEDSETLEKKPDPRRSGGSQEGNSGRNSSRQAPESAEPRDERRFNSYKSNHSHQQGRDRNQFHNRRNDYEENGRQYQRYDNYSQNGAPRRNNQRDGYYNNPNTDRRGGYQQDRGGRGRNNPRYQNRNAGFEGGPRRNQHNQENSTFQNNRNYRSAPRKSEDSYLNASSRNDRFNETRTVDGGAQVSPDVNLDVVNGSKSFDASEVKAFVPKEDSSVSFGVESESHSQKVPYPPPGFSNPLKKVVYGLEAAKPPPGFPRR